MRILADAPLACPELVQGFADTSPMLVSTSVHALAVRSRRPFVFWHQGGVRLNRALADLRDAGSTLRIIVKGGESFVRGLADT
jgi:hypothetical protein